MLEFLKALENYNCVYFVNWIKMLEYKKTTAVRVLKKAFKFIFISNENGFCRLEHIICI